MVVQVLKYKMKKEMKQKRMVQFFSALADETRLKILTSLTSGAKTVSEIHSQFEESITLSAVSHQLKILSSTEIIEGKKSGREKKYSLSGEFCWCILRDAAKHFGIKYPKVQKN